MRSSVTYFRGMIFGLLSTSLSAPFSEYTSPDLGSTSVIFTAGGSLIAPETGEETRRAHQPEWVERRRL